MRRVLKVLTYTLGVALLIAVGLVAYIRFAPDDARIWHVDPAEITRTGKPNDYYIAEGGDMVSPVYVLTPAELMSAIRKVALSEPRTSVLGEKDGYVTFVQRSALMGYPDYISVKAVEAEGGAQLILWSRSRYGYSDMGVNKARASRWLEKL